MPLGELLADGKRKLGDLLNHPATSNPLLAAKFARQRANLTQPESVMDPRYPAWKKAQDDADKFMLLSDVIGAAVPMAGPAARMGVVGVRSLVPKAGQMAEGYMARTGMMQFAAPQEEALRLAQQRAALPVEQHGLGLPPDNTPQMRANAMGFTGEGYHGSMSDIKKFSPDKASTESHAGRGTYITDSPEDASRNYASIWGPDRRAKVESAMENLAEDRNSMRLIGKRFQDETLTPRQQEILLANTTQADNLGAVYPLKYRADKPISIDNGAKNPPASRVGPFEKYDDVADTYTETPAAKDLGTALREYESQGGDPSDIYNVLADFSGDSVDAAELYHAAKKGSGHMIDEFSGDMISGGVAGSDFVRNFGVDQISHTPLFRNPQLNLGSEHTVALNPDNIRSRFAAFDPWRRTTTLASLLGLAAPDLLAAPQSRK